MVGEQGGDTLIALVDATHVALVGEQVADALCALAEASLGELVQELIDAALGALVGKHSAHWSPQHAANWSRS